MSKASRAYVIEFGASKLVYAIGLIASIWLIQQNPQAPWRYAVALANIVPTMFAVLAFVRFPRRMDELQRRIQLEALGLSFAATGILTFVYGFLQNVGFPPISWIWIFPMMIALWGSGSAIASARYR